MKDAFDPPQSGPYVSTDKALIDRAWVTSAVLAEYFGKWRTPEIIARSIEHSLCFGLYERQPQNPAGPTIPDRQIGFARVVTDYATHGWVCDVIIAESERHRGLGRFLMRAIFVCPELAGVLLELRTKDKQTFYGKLGFEPVVSWRRLPTT